LRKQWHQELSDKFFLPSVLLETKAFNEQIRQGNASDEGKIQLPQGAVCPGRSHMRSVSSSGMP